MSADESNIDNKGEDQAAESVTKSTTRTEDQKRAKLRRRDTSEIPISAGSEADNSRNSGNSGSEYEEHPSDNECPSETEEDTDVEDFWLDEPLDAGAPTISTSPEEPIFTETEMPGVTGDVVEEDEAPPQQRLLRLAKKFEFAAANDLIKQLAELSLPLERDDRKRTAAHYAAMHSRGQAALQLLVGRLGPVCLTDQDREKRAPIHFAARFYTRRQFALLVKEIKKKYLEVKDTNGDTCIHWAARNRRCRDVALVVVQTVGPVSLTWQNLKRRSGLCEILTNCRAQTAKQLLEMADPLCLGLNDEEGNTWAHCAADNRIDEAAILTAVEFAGPECLAWQNQHRLSVLQRALQDCSSETAIKLISLAAPETLSLKNEDGTTCLHAVNKNKEEVLLAAVERAGVQCLTWQNGKKQSVLHDAVLRCRPDVACQLVQMANTECLNLRDEDGNTCLHDAVRSDSKIDVVLAAVQVTGWWCLSWQNNKKQSVLYLAVSTCSSDAANHLLKMAPSVVLQVDGDGNTLLHSLFQSEKHRHTDSELQEFISMMTTLVGAGVSLRTENNIGQNCLHSTSMQEKCLAHIMSKAITSEPAKNMFKQLLRNSNGLHVVHAFSSRYRLRDVVKPLARLSDLQISDLVRLTVTMDTNKGATCLHFACEGGNKENIEYLMNQGLQLQTVTHSGLSCIDYAFDKGKLDDVLEVAEVCHKGLSKTELLRLVDPGFRALKLPDRLSSRQLIASIAHESLRKGEKDTKSGGDCGDKHKGKNRSLADIPENNESGQKKEISRTDLDVLLKALELDSSRIIRSSLSLNLVTADTERVLLGHLTQRLKAENYDRKRYFKDVDDFLSEVQVNATSELSIIDIAAYFNKVNILPDLVLTRQFELIPACILLLVHLKLKVAQSQGKDEELTQLRAKIVCILVNTLDDLFISASEEEKNLLVDYILGDLRDNEGNNPGPLFPCRDFASSDSSSIRYMTLMEMVEECDCNELIETDCLYQVTKTAWHPRSHESGPNRTRRSVNPFTAKAKFFIHHIAFVIFLAYGAWYVVDFNTSFVNRELDTIITLYALSLTLQEMLELYRGRKLKNHYLGNRVIKCPSYFENGITNLFDWASILLLWAGLVWRWILIRPHTPLSNKTSEYGCQMLLTTSFMLWGFRSVSFLSYYERTGPMISMMSSLLLRDLLPFLLVLFVIFYVFGIFFFNLLFPVGSMSEAALKDPDYGFNVFLKIFTMPFNLLFTNFDKTTFEPAETSTNLTFGKLAHPTGLKWFNNIWLFIFLLLVNLVMMNLLIALFSLRVSRMESQALGIWRRTYFEMLSEFKQKGPMPPPLSFVSDIIILIVRAIRSRRVEPTEKNEWWLNEFDYPDEYARFLKFQATRLRRVRPHLAREVTRNRSDFDGLKAHTGNLLETLEERLDGRLADMSEKQEESATKFSSKIERVEKRLVEKLQRLETQELRTADDQQPLQKTSIDDRLDSLEAMLLEEMRSIRNSISMHPTEQTEEEQTEAARVREAERVAERRFKGTERRLRRQRKRMQNLDAKMDAVIGLLKKLSE